MSYYMFRPAKSITERHGLFVALVGETNSGKTYSALRLARGIAGPTGKLAVLDTEGGRTLHLKNEFDFDVLVMEPPHRPERYIEAARAAQDAGYDALLIDSFTMEWRGVGGVLDWIDAELDAAVERQKATAAAKGYSFNEDKARFSNKLAATIRPKMAHKLMVAGFLGLRIPIIFSIRGETTLDPDTKKEKFKAQCHKGFLFEVTVSFRLASDRKGIIDLSDPSGWKMEAAHRAIFRDGDQLSEEHGAKLAEWARGGLEAPADPFTAARAAAGNGAEAFREWWRAASPADRAAVKPRLEELRTIAAEADAAPGDPFGEPPAEAASEPANDPAPDPERRAALETAAGRIIAKLAGIARRIDLDQYGEDEGVRVEMEAMRVEAPDLHRQVTDAWADAGDRIAAAAGQRRMAV